MKKTFKLSASDSEFYNTESISFYYPQKINPIPNMQDIFKKKFSIKPTDFSELILTDSNDIKKLKNLALEYGIYLSNCNSKVAKGAYKTGYKSPVSFGKTNIASCMYASTECKESCYQIIIQKMYANSRNAHLYNALIMANLTYNEIYNAINLTLNFVKPDLIRLLDDGDFSVAGEFKVWNQIAIENPQIRIYGYTKAGELIENAKINPNIGVVWNLSDNGDQVSQDYAEKLHMQGFKLCNVLYTFEYDKNTPFNNEESLAIMTPAEIKEKFNTLKFAIAYHGTKYPKVEKFYHAIELESGIKVC